MRLQHTKDNKGITLCQIKKNYTNGCAVKAKSIHLFRLHIKCFTFIYLILSAWSGYEIRRIKQNLADTIHMCCSCLFVCLFLHIMLEQNQSLNIFLQISSHNSVHSHHPCAVCISTCSVVCGICFSLEDTKTIQVVTFWNRDNAH